MFYVTLFFSSYKRTISQLLYKKRTTEMYTLSVRLMPERRVSKRLAFFSTFCVF